MFKQVPYMAKNMITWITYSEDSIFRVKWVGLKSGQTRDSEHKTG